MKKFTFVGNFQNSDDPLHIGKYFIMDFLMLFIGSCPLNPIRSGGGGSHCPPKWKTRVLIFFALMTSNFFYLLFLLCKYASFGIFFRSIGQSVMVLRPLEDGSWPIFAYLENMFFGSPHQILQCIK